MSAEVEAFPLQWPAGRERTRDHNREDAKFGRVGLQAGYSYTTKSKLTLAEARERTMAELDRLGARSVVISSNVPLRLDGFPRSGQAEPKDPGVAVYFSWNKEQHCMACDRYTKVADNLCAVAKHLDAMRGQLRWGVADTRAMFAGFKALPPPSGQPTSPQWWNVLGVPHDYPTDSVRQKYRELARKHHPDVEGGDAGAMALINRAYEQFQKERGL